MQSQITQIIPVLRNVLTTANLQQAIDLSKFPNFTWGTYSLKNYGGSCGYVKSSKMQGRVTIFRNGKMISIGTDSVEKSIEQLYHAKKLLIKENFISDSKLEPKIQNLVSTLALNHKLNIFEIASKLKGAIYEPEQFPGIILKSVRSTCYLIFASGKIVITGAKSISEMNVAAFEICQKLSNFKLENNASLKKVKKNGEVP